MQAALKQPLAIGMMRLGDYPDLASDQALLAFVEQCLEQGVSVFDHADIYGAGSCEARFGQALALKPPLRKDLVLISKADIVTAQADKSPWQVKHYDTSCAYLQQQLDGSLQRLGTDYLDGFLVHRPDPLMDVRELAQTLQGMISSGKVRWVGVSNFLPTQWQALAEHVPLACNQIELSLAAQSAVWDGQLNLLSNANVQVMAWSPMAGGRFAGHLLEALSAVAAQRGVTAEQIALAWVRALPGAPMAILGSLRSERITDALAGLSLQLTRQEWFYLAEAARGHQVA